MSANNLFLIWLKKNLVQVLNERRRWIWFYVLLTFHFRLRFKTKTSFVSDKKMSYPSLKFNKNVSVGKFVFDMVNKLFWWYKFSTTGKIVNGLKKFNFVSTFNVVWLTVSVCWKATVGLLQLLGRSLFMFNLPSTFDCGLKLKPLCSGQEIALSTPSSTTVRVWS